VLDDEKRWCYEPEHQRDKKTDERSIIEDEIKKVDNEIDQAVYKLYGLTQQEIAIVEKSLTEMF